MVDERGGISALAVATGPSLESVLIDAGGWRWAFYVNLPIALVAGLATRRLVRESVIGGPVPDLVGVAMLSGAVASLALAITQGGDWGWSSTRVISLFVLAAVLAPIAVRRSAHHEAPAIDLGVLRSRTVALANAATFLYSVGFFGMLLANVLFLPSVWHYSTLEAGIAITPGPLLVAALSGPSGRLAARVGYGPVLVAGGLTFAGGLLFYVAVGSETAPQRRAAQWRLVSSPHPTNARGHTIASAQPNAGPHPPTPRCRSSSATAWGAPGRSAPNGWRALAGDTRRRPCAGERPTTAAV